VVLQRVRRVGALVAFSTINPEILEMVQEDLTAMVFGALLDTCSLSLIATTATTIKLQPNRIS
jgi:fluoride ion exporter CrcB/FEX